MGEDVKLMVDANLRWTPAEAMARCRLLEDLDLYWMEEPLDADDVLGHEQLSRHTSHPHCARREPLQPARLQGIPDSGSRRHPATRRRPCGHHRMAENRRPGPQLQCLGVPPPDDGGPRPSGMRDAQRAFRGAGSDAGTLSATPSADRRRLRGSPGAARPRRGLRPGQVSAATAWRRAPGSEGSVIGRHRSQGTVGPSPARVVRCMMRL